MKNTSTFKSKHLNKAYQIKKNFNCTSKMVVCLIECRVWGKQYNGSTVTKFRVELTTIKARFVIFQKNKYCQTKPVTELYWYHKLKTCTPYGLNERDVYAVY